MTHAPRRSPHRGAGGAHSADKTSGPGLRHLLAMAALCAVSGLAWAAPSATVLFSSGEVRAVSAKGEVRELKTGAQIESGETVQTGKGRVQLRMVDGALMALSEQTTLRIDDYRVATSPGGEERGFMSLVRGALRTISGRIGHPREADYRLDTPSGTIGIRGTDHEPYEVNADLAEDDLLAGSQISRFLVLHKELDADDGELTRTNKVRRGFIADKYQALVDALYGGKTEQYIETQVKFEDGRSGSVSATLQIADAKTFAPARKAA